MSDEKKGGLDIFGIKPIAEATLVVTKGLVDGAGAFLGRICLPAAEEFGLLLKDKVSGWRAGNVISIAGKAERLLEGRAVSEQLHAHPRIVGRVIEQGSWEDNDAVQGMWAGLLASACTKDGTSQQNLIFISILEQLTSSEALLVQYACQNAKPKKSKSGLIVASSMTMPTKDVLQIMGTNDYHMADVELDHLREIGLLAFDGGFDTLREEATITPSALGLNFYARCQGFVGSPLDFFGVTEVELDEIPDDPVEAFDNELIGSSSETPNI